MIPGEFFDFDPPTPPWTGGPLLWGCVSNLLCVLRLLCVDLTRVLNNVFLVCGPPNPWLGFRVQTLGTPGWPLPVRTQPFSCWMGYLVAPENFSHLDFFLGWVCVIIW